MEAITIPVGAPLTFDDLKRLNPAASVEELAEAFGCLPAEMRGQAWTQLGLRAALEEWSSEGGDSP